MDRTIYLPIKGVRVGVPRNPAFQPFVQAACHAAATVEAKIGTVNRPEGLCFSLLFEEQAQALAFIDEMKAAVLDQLEQSTIDLLVTTEAGRPTAVRSSGSKCVLFWEGIEIVDRRKSGLDS